MAFSNNYSQTYASNDVELNATNAVIMPQGTSSYTLSSGHTGVVARKSSTGVILMFIMCNDGVSENFTVQPGDAVFDISSVYATIKFSTGGNSDVNMITYIPPNHNGEADSPGRIYWFGEFKVSGF